MDNNPYKSPESEVEVENNDQSATEQIRRGGWLTAVLILFFIGSTISTSLFIINWKKLLLVSPAWYIYTLTGIAAVRLCTVVAIWFWSKSGVVVYALLTVLAVTVLEYHGQNVGVSGIIGTAILLIVVRPKWKYMSWGISNIAGRTKN